MLTALKYRQNKETNFYNSLCGDLDLWKLLHQVFIHFTKYSGFWSSNLLLYSLIFVQTHTFIKPRIKINMVKTTLLSAI